MDDLLKEFLAETLESLEVIDFELVKFEQEPDNKQILDNIFRLLHTIKGTCGFLGLPKLQSVAHASETLMDRYRDGLAVSTDGVTAILKSIDEIKTILDHLTDTGEEPDTIDETLIKHLDGLSGASEASNNQVTFQEVMAMQQAGLIEFNAPQTEEEAGDAPSMPVAEKSPCTEADGGDATVTDANRLSEPTPAPQPSLSSAKAVDIEKAATLRREGSGAKPEKATADESHGEHGTQNQAIRVNLDLLEHLMNTVSELVLTRNQLLEIFRHQSDSEFKVPLLRLSSVTTELQDTIVKTRMQPIGNAWKKLPRIVRDLAQSLDKKIDLVMSGGETELDRQVLEQIKDPLTHMVRNSADHGIETPEDREKAGKSERGTIRLSSYHEGGQVIIRIADNGRGLNADAIRDKLISNGAMSMEAIEKLTKQQLYNQVFEPGFSTAAEITSVSGRGVGMDVVRTNIELIGGTISLESEPGQGTTATIKIPLTLAIIPALIIESAGNRFAVPQASVIELVRTKDDNEHVIDTIKNTRVLRLRDKLLPLIGLNDVFEKHQNSQTSSLRGADEGNTAVRPEATDVRENKPHNDYIIVMQVGPMLFGVIVDNVFHTEEIVVKPMTSLLKGQQIFSGNTILGDGRVILIVDPNGIAQHVRSQDIRESDDDTINRSKSDGYDREALLLFHAGGDEPKLVPLSLVTRLEEIPVEQIERNENGYVVQYRDTLMPLIMISSRQSLKTEGNQPMIVFTESGLSLGLVVDEFIDIADEKLSISLSSDKSGVLGTAVVREKATEVIDIGHYLTLTFEEWFIIKDRPELGSKPQVLLVDDSPFFQNLLKPIIQSAGFRVTVASSGEAALAILEQQPYMDIIVSDLDMEPIDGYALAAQVKATSELASIPVIAMSSQARTEIFQKVQAAGFDDLVGKFDRPGLVATLKTLRGVYGDAA